MIKFKKIILIFVFVVLGQYIFADKIFAQSFSFTPSSVTKKVGETFEVTVQIDAGTKQVKGADLKINFDSDILKIVKVENGGFFPSGGHNVSGDILYISYGIDQAVVTKTGLGDFALITFEGIDDGDGETKVACSGQTNDTNIWDEQTNDIVVCSQIKDPVYTIVNDTDEADSDSPSVTKTPTPTPPVSGIALPTFFSLGIGLLLALAGVLILI